MTCGCNLNAALGGSCSAVCRATSKTTQSMRGLFVPSMSETQQPTLITNPAGDVAFGDHAEELVKGIQSVAEFQRVLRREYPRAVVRARDLAGERPIVWYVYRDGHWVARDDRQQG